MNARTQTFEFSVEGHQVEEVVGSIFHTVLFYRTLGKFTYRQQESYVIGAVGQEDVDCDFLDLTYVRCSSPALANSLRSSISAFSEALRGMSANSANNNSGGAGSAGSNGGTGTGGCGQISLEFYQRKKVRWSLAPDDIPWELWTVRLNLLHLNNEHERQVSRERLGELLSDRVFHIAELMNRSEYVPKTPHQADLDQVFDTSFPDVQPYLFKVTSSPSNASVGTALKKFVRDTFAM